MEALVDVFGKKEHITVFQDESIFHTNEHRHRVWVKDGQQPLRKKGNGHCVHVSDFITEQGRLVLTEEEETQNKASPAPTQAKPDAKSIIYPGKGHNAWWDCQQLVNQV